MSKQAKRYAPVKPRAIRTALTVRELDRERVRYAR